MDDQIEKGAEASLVTPKFLAIGAAVALVVVASSCRPDASVGLDNGTVGAAQVAQDR